MVNTSSNKLTKFFIMAALSVGTLAACKDSASDDNTNRNPVVTGDSAAAVNGTSGYGKDKAPASATAKKKGKASIGTSESSATAATKGTGEKMVVDKEGVYNKATVMPEFPGGEQALSTYVNNHVEYPQQAIEYNTAGTVRVSFVVDEKGKVQQAKVVSGQVGNGLDQEALRVVNNMPAWKPGKVKGHNVKTRLELPINFQLEA
jgi:protein TonB